MWPVKICNFEKLATVSGEQLTLFAYEAILFFFAGFIFLVVPGRLQQTCVAALTGTSKTTKCPACLGQLSDAPLEEGHVPFAVK